MVTEVNNGPLARTRAYYVTKISAADGSYKLLRWASASGPKARSRSFGREASKTREHYSYVPGHFFLSDYICFCVCLCQSTYQRL